MDAGAEVVTAGAALVVLDTLGVEAAALVAGVLVVATGTAELAGTAVVPLSCGSGAGAGARA